MGNNSFTVILWGAGIKPGDIGATVAGASENLEAGSHLVVGSWNLRKAPLFMCPILILQYFKQ